jgi:diaminohydroxyphosphoribosylaminopyrimidine deaminase / 5-amino-6-(5-phosphoribosylamino)uracil reductase
MFTPTDHAMMSRAMQIAERGRAVATPNPFVGCVIVKHGRIIGEGYTRAGGRPHAEADALANCTESAEGATVYSTLEPCAIHASSRGPACSDLLVEAKVARVVSALHDPFEGVDGKGHARLRTAGIALEIGLMEAEVKKQLKAFLARVTRNRPYVTLKIASSIDGKTALNNGESQWITSAESRRDVHAMRRDACAMLTGIGTVLADNPSLTVRDVPCERQPLRIVLDNQLAINEEMAILAGGNTLIVTTTDNQTRVAQLALRGVEVVMAEAEASHGKIDLMAMMQMLAAKKLNSIMVETGAKLNASLIMADVVDEIVFYVAPSILGDNAKGLFALPELHNMRDKINLKFSDVRQIGADIKITALIDKNI